LIIFAAITGLVGVVEALAGCSPVAELSNNAPLATTRRALLPRNGDRTRR